MDLQRVIALNHYTRLDIEEYGYTPPDDPTVICVGNLLMRRQLEQYIKGKTPVSIFGYGKSTAVLDVCDRLHLEYVYGLDFYDDEAVYIIRNPKKSQIEQYINMDVRLVVLYDKLNVRHYTKAVIRLGELSSNDMTEYEDIKGYPMITRGKTLETYTKQSVAKFLRRGKRPLPENTHRWFSQNFPTNRRIQTICALAHRVQKNKELSSELAEAKVAPPNPVSSVGFPARISTYCSE